MGHTRRYSGDESVLMACSICGNSFEWPADIRRCNDGLFRCNVYCTESTNLQSEDRVTAQSRKTTRDVENPRIPGALKPDWWP